MGSFFIQVARRTKGGAGAKQKADKVPEKELGEKKQFQHLKFPLQTIFQLPVNVALKQEKGPKHFAWHLLPSGHLMFNFWSETNEPQEYLALQCIVGTARLEPEHE